MDVLQEVNEFYDNFTEEKRVLGNSYEGRRICALRVKKSQSPKIIFTYAVHGREYITSYLALKQAEAFCRDGRRGDVWFLPVVNPDGVYLSLYGNPLNKANARQVDLNVNFDADWGKGVRNVFFPAAENFVGSKPFSERESSIIRDFTLEIKPDLTVSYHSKGEEIYFKYKQDATRLIRDEAVAKIVADTTGYAIKDAYGSCGGYKDWCIDALKIPAITIEVGCDKLLHPLTKENLSEIYDKNKDVVFRLTEIKWLKNLWVKR